MSRRPRRRPLVLLLALALGAAAPAACGDDESGSGAGGRGDEVPAEETGPVTLRLGYFPNVTHASALVGIEGGIFEEKLGSNVTLETKSFNAGPTAIEALFADAIDATYIGPNPAINAFAQSNGKAIRIVSGATSGGAFFVVKPAIGSAADLKGKKIATPQLGGTQDIAARSWLQSKGLKTDAAGGGDVSILPQDNATTLEAFRTSQIDGAWVPEPWATRLVQEGGGKVLIDEATLWPGRQYVTTHLIVSTKFLEKHPATVKKLIEGQVAANEYLETNPAHARTLVNQGITKITGRGIATNVLDAAWTHLVFTNDPIASSLTASAKDAEKLGLLKPVDLEGIYDLRLLNQVLEENGLSAAKDR